MSEEIILTKEHIESVISRCEEIISDCENGVKCKASERIAGCFTHNNRQYFGAENWCSYDFKYFTLPCETMKCVRISCAEFKQALEEYKQAVEREDI